MEVALAIGAGAYTINALYGGGEPDRVNKSEEEELVSMLESQWQMTVNEGRNRGVVARHSNADAGRVPWNPANPPYSIYHAGANNTANPTEQLYRTYANAFEHERLLVKEEIANGRQHYARRRGQAVWQAYNRELHVPNLDPRDPPRSTNVAGWMWMPPNPHDVDRNEAAALGRAMPADERLTTPDMHYFANPGVTWRNTIQQH